MNPYTARWTNLHQRENRAERALAKLENQYAEEQPVIECEKCGSPAYYRPGVGAYQCVSCGSVRRYDGGWV